MAVDPQAHRGYGLYPYAYCGNNPIICVDPDGKFPWLAVAIGAAIFATGNVAAHAIRGDINNFGDFGEAFLQGAITGALLGATWGFTGSAYLGGIAGVLGTTSQIIHTTMTVYGVAQVAMGGRGMIGGAINEGWVGTGKAAKVFLGNFYLDENDFLEGIIQGFTRHSWEMLQSAVGHGYTQFRNMAGNVDRVDYLGGATFATKENQQKQGGGALGNYININLWAKIDRDFDTYATTVEPLFMHEYGHTIDSRIFGFSYLFAVGIPSAISAKRAESDPNWNHDNYWTEKRANSHAEKYFKQYYRIK